MSDDGDDGDSDDDGSMGYPTLGDLMAKAGIFVCMYVTLLCLHLVREEIEEKGNA